MTTEMTGNEFDQAIIKLIEKERKKNKRLTGRKLAESLGLDYSTFNNWRRKKGDHLIQSEIVVKGISDMLEGKASPYQKYKDNENSNTDNNEIVEILKAQIESQKQLISLLHEKIAYKDETIESLKSKKE